MPDANEPRLMPPRGDGKRKPDFDNATGNAGRDGFTRVARRAPPPSREGPFYFGPPPLGGVGTMDPPVGQRDFGRGPRFSEDW